MRATTKLFFILLGLLTACEEKIDISIKSENSNLLVVEGVLTNEKTNHIVKLSHPYQELNGTSMPATGAIVTITDGTVFFPLTETPSGSGIYLTDSMIAVIDHAYLLQIQYQGKQYSAQDTSVPVEPLAALSYRATYDSLHFTLNLSPSGTSSNYIRHDINWENTNFCISSNTCQGEIIYYDLKTIDVNDIFKPSKVEFDFPIGARVIRKKYSTSPAYKAFLRGILSETEWRGGVFDVERANAPTNLSAGAIGFFAVSTVLSDTTVVN